MDFAHFESFQVSDIIIRGPNCFTKDRHPCRWDERTIFSKRSVLHEERAHDETKLSHSHPQFPWSTLGTPGFLHRCFPVFRNINLLRLVVLGCCLLAAVTKFQGKLASLPQVNSPNSQDNFQICCADMYLLRFLANFAGFRVFLWISRDSPIYLKFAAPRPREISEALVLTVILRSHVK